MKHVALVSFVLGVPLLVACGGKVVFGPEGDGGAGGTSSQVAGTLHASVANGTTHASTGSGPSACEAAANTIEAKAKSCGLTTDTGPTTDDQPCSTQDGIIAQALAACWANAKCDAIVGTSETAGIEFTQCESAAANAGASTGGSH